MKHFLIYISQPYSIPIGVPLQQEIERRGFRVKWFCDEIQTQENFRDKQRLLKSVEEVLAYHPDVVLVASNEVPDFFSGLKVQIFHGFSVGKRTEAKGHFNIRGFFDLYCTQGASTTEPFKLLSKKHTYFKVVETGWSKVDALFPLEHTNNKKPIVMISSTFTSRLSLAQNVEAMDEIKRLISTKKWFFIAVLHPKIEAKIVNAFKAMQNEYFTFYDTTDLVPLSQKVDVMLSDTTSAITEFILQKKPVVTLNNNQPLPHLINITQVQKIEEALEYALSQPSAVMQNIEDFILHTHPFDDGKSSKRVIDACLDFLEKDTIKRKPLNLIRRYKIRKKLQYFKR
ncbi:MAG: hypothetical protein Q9M36_15360 [Sulfurovum sp.]|nr:hypothetical protein [Sulfurovum sp.]